MGTFNDVTQLKLAKSTSYFLFRSFAPIKKKLNQNPYQIPLEQGTDESLRTTASVIMFTWCEIGALQLRNRSYRAGLKFVITMRAFENICQSPPLKVLI